MLPPLCSREPSSQVLWPMDWKVLMLVVEGRGLWGEARGPFSEGHMSDPHSLQLLQSLENMWPGPVPGKVYF